MLPSNIDQSVRASFAVLQNFQIRSPRFWLCDSNPVTPRRSLRARLGTDTQPNTALARDPSAR
jgi:hypothetical protein